ncbi:MAG: amino acid permease [Halobacteriota archaeon]|nr:amino acid permease [Halobacteriota archaeon]
MTRSKLTRNLGFWDALMLGIGTMIGAGIFILPSIAAKRAGPASAISYLIGGLIAILTALSISELASGMPKAGGSYYFINRSLGPFFGTITGIGMWLGLIFASAFYMIGFEYYLSNLVPFGPREIAIGMTIIMIIINLHGTKGAGNFQKVSVIILLGILVTFIAVNALDVKTGNLEPFAPEGWGAVVGLAGTLFIGFMGFEVIATVAEEIKDPRKNLWRAMIASVVIVTIIYMIIMIVAIGGVGQEELGLQDTPISYAARNGPLGDVGWVLMTIAAILATVSSANASILSASRISFAMGKDRILHPWLNEIHKKFMTPSNSIAITGTLILAFQIFGKVVLLAEIAGFMFLLTFFLIHICVWVLRRTDPEWYKPSFSSPFFPLVQIIGSSACLILIAQMDILSQAVGGLMVLVAILWYVGWSSRKSRVEGEVKKVFDEIRLEEAKKVIHAEEEVTKKILVPFTNLLYERIKIRIAAALATEKGTMVRLNVVTIPYQVPLESALSYIDAEKIKLMDEIKKLDEKVEVNKEYKQIIAHSAPDAIMKVAKEDNCELILLGRYMTRLSTTRIKETLAGYVLHRANTDIGVLSMNAECIAKVRKRRGLDTKKGGKASDKLPRIKKILVPYDDNYHTPLALEFARKIGIFEEATVTLFKVSFKKDIEENKEKMERIMKDFSVEGFKLKPKIVTAMSPAKEIIAASEEYDLIIMGASKSWVLNKFLFGSIPDRVMAEASCPVFFAKKRESKAFSALKGRFF